MHQRDELPSKGAESAYERHLPASKRNPHDVHNIGQSNRMVQPHSTIDQRNGPVRSSLDHQEQSRLRVLKHHQRLPQQLLHRRSTKFKEHNGGVCHPPAEWTAGWNNLHERLVAAGQHRSLDMEGDTGLCDSGDEDTINTEHGSEAWSNGSDVVELPHLRL